MEKEIRWVLRYQRVGISIKELHSCYAKLWIRDGKVCISDEDEIEIGINEVKTLHEILTIFLDWYNDKNLQEEK